MRLPPYTSPLARAWHYVFLFICACVFFFLIAPVLVVIPLSFNAETYFTFSDAMLRLDPDAFSLQWYRALAQDPNRPDSETSAWVIAAKNSLIIALTATAISTVLGTLAAVGLTRRNMPWRGPVMALLISPMIVPIIITGAGMFLFYSSIGLAFSMTGMVLAHAALGTPFVVITVTATLASFDENLIRAAFSVGAKPLRTFWSVILPLCWPGVISGALFAFITSFDEVVVVIFLAAPDQPTIPQLIWGGIRQEITLSILAAATILIAISTLCMISVELLRRRSERLRGVRA
ncbi:MAG: ABC transporter permease [Pseudomonadota bacterium]